MRGEGPVRDLGEVGVGDRAAVGGKGASLGELARDQVAAGDLGLFFLGVAGQP